MLGRMGSRTALIASLMIGMGSFAGSVNAAPTVTMNAPRNAKRGLFGGVQMTAPRLYGYKGAGISMAQQQRASKKRKNVKRHRRHVRG